MNGRRLFTVAGRVKRGTAAASMIMIMVGATASGAQAAGPVWTVTPSPNATLSGGKIESVSCSDPGACTAVGTNLDTSGISVTLAERWNGTSWQRQATPNPPGNTDPSVAPNLLGVSCPAAAFCAAVGDYKSGFTQVSMAETWNGRRGAAVMREARASRWVHRCRPGTGSRRGERDAGRNRRLNRREALGPGPAAVARLSAPIG